MTHLNRTGGQVCKQEVIKVVSLGGNGKKNLSRVSSPLKENYYVCSGGQYGRLIWVFAVCIEIGINFLITRAIKSMGGEILFSIH